GEGGQGRAEGEGEGQCRGDSGPACRAGPGAACRRGPGCGGSPPRPRRAADNHAGGGGDRPRGEGPQGEGLRRGREVAAYGLGRAAPRGRRPRAPPRPSRAAPTSATTT